MRTISMATIVLAASTAFAQPPRPAPPSPGASPRAQTPPPAPPAPGTQPPGARPQFRPPRRIEVMTVTSSAWPDGGTIPAKYTQAGGEVSPALSWSNVPDDVVSFVLIAHDPDTAVGNGNADMLHWMVWDIPGNVRSVPEGVAQGPEMPDGARQISATGPFYRGPGAAAAGPAHHYLFELYALDAKLDVPAVGQSPAQTRTAIEAAMAGHVRAKGVYVGLFKRSGSG